MAGGRRIDGVDGAQHLAVLRRRVCRRGNRPTSRAEVTRAPVVGRPISPAGIFSPARAAQDSAGVPASAGPRRSVRARMPDGGRAAIWKVRHQNRVLSSTPTCRGAPNEPRAPKPSTRSIDTQ